MFFSYILWEIVLFHLSVAHCSVLQLSFQQTHFFLVTRFLSLLTLYQREKGRSVSHVCSHVKILI